jgi:hypothetical protein
VTRPLTFGWEKVVAVRWMVTRPFAFVMQGGGGDWVATWGDWVVTRALAFEWGGEMGGDVAGTR